MASDMSVYFVTWSAFIARDEKVESVTIDETDANSFQNIALILLAIGTVFNGVFHIFTVEKSQDNEIESSSMIGSDTIKLFECAPTTVPMKWSDWFREKHYFQVFNTLSLLRILMKNNFNLLGRFFSCSESTFPKLKSSIYTTLSSRRNSSSSSTVLLDTI